MRKIIFLFFIFLSLLFNLDLKASEDKRDTVYIIPVKGVIDLGLSPFIERVLKEAEDKAELVIFEINTLGGRVDAAIRIKDAILDSGILSIAYVNKRAISAGALIALSAKKIVMAPGSCIGAVEPRPTDEKSISYIKAEMASIAEQRNRPVEIAKAMVDKDIEIKGLVEKGKLLTLSWEEALARNFADHKAKNLKEILKLYDLEEAKIIRVSPTWSENVVRFLTHPLVSSLLLTLGFIGLLSEFRTPTWGIAGTIGITCLVLFFASHFIAGLASWMNILLFIGGLIFIIAEVFFIPGFGIAGILGILAIGLSLILSFKDLKTASFTLSLTFIMSLVGLFLLFKYLPKTTSWKRLVLNSKQLKDEGFSSSQDLTRFLNKEGYALTPLHPSGSGIIEGVKLDVITEGDFLSKDTKIKVVKIEGNKIVVSKLEEENI